MKPLQAIQRSPTPRLKNAGNQLAPPSPNPLPQGEKGLWPVPGGHLERLGLEPKEIEARSRAIALTLANEKWRGEEAELAASVIYAAGDPSLVEYLETGGSLVASARQALATRPSVLVDVTMVEAGIRAPAATRVAVAISASGASELASRTGTTRVAAGLSLLWPELGAGSMVAIGNAPTAVLTVLDLAETMGPPAAVIATCPGFTIATEAKSLLAGSGLPYLTVTGTRGGSGLATAAVNFLLEST
jgi:precorrin-8X/cobalt-precorrin-8 methylmutase